ncbi:HNH endonuclease [Vibrio splendidus]
MLNAKFYETYYFCNIIRNVLNDQFSFARDLHEFYGDGRILGLIDPFQKYSTFHLFIEFVVENIYSEQITKVTSPMASKLPIERAMEFHSIEHHSFQEFLESPARKNSIFPDDNIADYIESLMSEGQFDALLKQTVKEVFHVLFQNRELMLEFNEMMASAFEMDSDIFTCEQEAIYLARKGKLKRKSIPKWVKRAVFFRDRGRCVLCTKDLSGMLSLENVENYDHIVPLAKFGLNDVSNIQLLCKECNQNEKRANSGITSSVYQSWYPYD